VIERIADARRFAAGLVQTALAAPLGLDDKPRTIGPFGLVAHALPIEVAPFALPPDFDVRPHPHIGLAAATYVLDGHVTHRDSLGSRHELGPGAIDHMVAGRGVVHSERFERLRTLGGRLELFQILLALPDGAEDVEPSFVAFDPARVPTRADAGAAIRVLADPGDGEAPLRHPTPIGLHDVTLAPGARYVVPDGLAERAVYVLSGGVELSGARVAAQ
jgi:redox-sensitive bicupin YhaK (pirin superfamily)